MKERIDKSQILNLGKVKQDFSLINSFYFSEVTYDSDGRFFDLYFYTIENVILENQIAIYNKVIENLNKYLTEVNEFIKSSYTKSERKKADELNRKKLTIDVIEISNGNGNFDCVLVCGKQYKYFGLYKRDIGIRVEIKNGQIIRIERKADTTKGNRK